MQNIKGIRFCLVAEDAEKIATCLSGQALFEDTMRSSASSSFEGATFPAGESRIEIWPASEAMQPTTMLQIVVDDADEWARKAKASGAEVMGPMDAHGERIYALTIPGDLSVTVQSNL